MSISKGKHDGWALTFVLTMCDNLLWQSNCCDIWGQGTITSSSLTHIQTPNTQNKAGFLFIWLTEYIFQSDYFNTSSAPQSVYRTAIAIVLFFTSSASPRKHNRGRRVTSGVSWPVCLKQPRQQSASVCRFCVRKRVNTPTFTSSLVWILSLPPLTRQLFYVCLLLPRPSWLTHTHTHTQGGQRGEPTGVSGEEDEWVSHTSEKWERHIKSSASISAQKVSELKRSTVSQNSFTVLWRFDNCGFFCKRHKGHVSDVFTWWTFQQSSQMSKA